MSAKRRRSAPVSRAEWDGAMRAAAVSERVPATGRPVRRKPDAVERAEARVIQVLDEWGIALARKYDGTAERPAVMRALSALRRAYRDAACECAVQGTGSKSYMAARERIKVDRLIHAAFARRRAK